MKRPGILVTLIILLGVSGQLNVAARKSLDFAFEQNRRMGRGVDILSADPRWCDPSKARIRWTDFAARQTEKGNRSYRELNQDIGPMLVENKGWYNPSQQV